ncbi:hypothetical protein [Novosphingobium sp. SG720]|uniref:hypothetical protein n=1 Tax=Novosphingobium sp. SG720 TaxID=2586998 RepID=UPI0014482405|nr:hypothetical protein [Novosphingobium sp. SG720]NKJ44243.1 quercetin dioxygenase-like cupin family protein [Novosphingobium sp. SG720]
MRRTLVCAAFMAAISLTTPAWAQATTRPCDTIETPGPACLLVHTPLPSLPPGPLFWHLDTFPSLADAEHAASATSTVTKAFGSVWLFTLQHAGWRPKGGKHMAEIGPLPLAAAATYSADYLRSVFKPGATAPLHVHSGPEAFYAVAGDTCLETPDGVQIGRGPGNSLLIKAGPPMLLMAIGKLPRQGFALILHDAAQPATTLTQTWQPQGLCARQLSADQEQTRR